MIDAVNTHEVVVLGSANLDLIATLNEIPSPGETRVASGLESRAGGKGLNQAVAAARAGASTALLAAVGTDDAADVLLGEATATGIDTSLVRVVDGSSGSAWIMVRHDGENAIVVHGAANTTLRSLNKAERDAVARSKVVVAQLETPLTAVAEAAALAREAGSRFVLNAAPAQTLPDELLSMVEVLVVNEHEARHLSGAADPAQAAGVLLGATGSVVVTLGASGALVIDGSGSRRVDGVPADVIDTTAAGDAFTGYLAASLAAGDSLDEAVARAVVAGAISVETIGAVPSIPTAEQVEHRVRAGRGR